MTPALRVVSSICSEVYFLEGSIGGSMLFYFRGARFTGRKKLVLN